MTFVLKFDLDIVKMYVCTKDETPTCTCSKVIARTDTQTDRWTDTQTDTQTDSTEIITYPHTRMVINALVRSPNSD